MHLPALLNAVAIDIGLGSGVASTVSGTAWLMGGALVLGGHCVCAGELGHQGQVVRDLGMVGRVDTGQLSRARAVAPLTRAGLGLGVTALSRLGSCQHSHNVLIRCSGINSNIIDDI